MGIKSKQSKKSKAQEAEWSVSHGDARQPKKSKDHKTQQSKQSKDPKTQQSKQTQHTKQTKKRLTKKEQD